MTRLWKTASIATIISVSPLLTPMTAAADVVEMPQQSQPTTEISVTLPGRGMTMSQVEERFGTPQQKFPEVGEPPIIRWIYPDFTVYFEYQYVINAVSHITGPAPAISDELPGAIGGASGAGEAMEEAPEPDAMMPAEEPSPSAP